MSLPLEEKLLIEQMLAGQTMAWNDFVAQFQRLVTSAIRHTAARCQFRLDASDFEDITAEVFASLIVNDFRSLRQFRGQCRISTWLTVIAHRTCLQQLSCKKRNRDSLHTYEPECRSQPDVLTRMVRREQHEEIRTSVQRLNDKDRLLLNLYFEEQLSYAEIGEQAGISVNSVGPKLSRAIGRLRKIVRRVYE